MPKLRRKYTLKINISTIIEQIRNYLKDLVGSFAKSNNLLQLATQKFGNNTYINNKVKIGLSCTSSKLRT